MRHFALDFTASDVAKLTGLTRKTTTSIFLRLRERVAEECERRSPFGGELEVDESYFGARRVRGKRGRGASGKTIVFGIFKRNGRVYTEVVPDCRSRALPAVIRGRVELDAVVHSDGWRGYDGLVDVGYAKHFPSGRWTDTRSPPALNAWQRFVGLLIITRGSATKGWRPFAGSTD